MNLSMTPTVTVVGSMVVFTAVVAAVVFFPTVEYQFVKPSEIFRPRTEVENEGRQIYRQNGCQYCHSQYVRTQDWDYGSVRVAQAGDYYEDQPPFLGSERQAPDLSLEGGLRSDGWHYAHFFNPRFTRPDSIMPPFHNLGRDRIEPLIAYVQSLGGKIADERMERQRRWQREAKEGYDRGPYANMEWLHSRVPDQWMNMPNPYPSLPGSVARGAAVYQHFCIGCHGPVGDGEGPAAPLLRVHGGEAPPFNFTHLNNWDGPIGGMIYYQVMNGITGTAMMAFKTELESEKIWDVANYIQTHFVNQPVGTVEEGPHGIPASYEPLEPGELEPGQTIAPEIRGAVTPPGVPVTPPVTPGLTSPEILGLAPTAGASASPQEVR
jgi:cytochrome c oxidase cbb3-type subunit 2